MFIKRTKQLSANLSNRDVSIRCTSDKWKFNFCILKIETKKVSAEKNIFFVSHVLECDQLDKDVLLGAGCENCGEREWGSQC